MLLKLGSVAGIEAPFGPQKDFLGHGAQVSLNSFSCDRVAAGPGSGGSDFVPKNLENRNVEVWLDGVEVGVKGKRLCEGFPFAPHAILVGGGVRRDCMSVRCLRSAESTEEITAGLGIASCQG